MPNKDFLESYSLFRKLEIEIADRMDEISKPAINMKCLRCNSIQTFNMINEYYEHTRIVNTNPSDKKIRAVYLCQSCKQFNRMFHIYVSPDLDYIYKYGQYPEWEIKMDKNLEKTLGVHAQTFRKGLVCESQGYGIGAFAYYRRIIEEIIDELLESIEDLIEVGNKENYKIALEATKKTRVTQEKIDLVKDLLPTILRPDGMNPLGVLHAELSEGLHAETDQKCLENAHHIRTIITFLINQIIQSKEAAKNFTSSMRNILNKKSNI